MFRKLIYLVSLVFLLSVTIPAKADLVITNGDFETGGGENITDVTDWYDNNAGGFWEDAWQTNASWITPNGSNVVVFCSWDTVEGDLLAGSYLYQSIGTSTGESSVTIGFDWGHPDDTAADRYDGLTVSVLASDGSFVADDANDVLGAAGITLLDSASYSHVALGTDGEIFPVVVTLDLSGANAGDEIFLRFNNYLPEAGADPWPVLDNVQITSEPAPTTPFSLGAVEDIELGNDSQTGPDSNSNGSGLGARDIPDRRRVILISYDISALKERGPVSNVSFNHFSHDQHDEVNVYGVIEDLDLLEVESLTWNTAPGVQNDPTPELNSPVALDVNDLTDVLLTFAGPGETGIRFSTDTSQALDDFINSDTDGILTFLIAPAAEGNQLIVRARTHSAGGTLLEGDAPPLANIIWVSDNLKYDFAAGAPSDQGFIDLLTAQGYLVDYKGQYDPHVEGNDEIPVNPDWLYWRELDDDKIAELEAADLIIIARDCASSKYDDTNEADMWNAISTPIISQNAHISRQLSKWGWFATGSTTNKTPRLMQVVAPDHPIFDGVAIDPNGNVDLVVQDAQVTLVKLNEGVVEGNGTLLGVHDEGYPWIVEWAAGVEYYEGSGQIAGGPRMFLGSAVGATNEAAGLIEGGYNLTADGETVFLNAVKYMLPAAPVENLVLNPSFEEDEAILDDPEWLQWCTWNPAEGAGSNATIVDTDAADGARSLLIEPIGTANWYFILLQDHIPLEVGAGYTATFWAKAAEPRPLGAQFKATDNTVSWGYTDFQLTTEWAEYSLTANALTAEAKLEFMCAGVEVAFSLDSVSVYKVADAPTDGTAANLALNPSFEEDEAILDDETWYSWCTWNPAEGVGSNATIVDTEAVDGARSLRVEPVGTESGHFIVANISFPLEFGADYTFAFWAKAEAARPLTASFKAADNSVSWGFTDFELTTEWAEYSLTATAESDAGKLEFLCGASEIPFWIDAVSAYKAE